MTDTVNMAGSEGRKPSANPKHNIYGHRPIKRAKRPYKNKGIPRAITQSANYKLQAEKSKSARKTKLLTTLRTGKQDKINVTRGFEKARLIRVLLAGATTQQVATELKLPINYCQNLLNDLEKEIKTIGKEEFVSLLWRKLQGFIEDHTSISGALELLLYQVDTDLRQISRRLEVVLDRIEIHQDQEPASGDAYNSARTVWQATHKALQAEHLTLTSARGALRTEKTALQREKRANNKDFVDTITRMGVTGTVPSSNNKVPPQVSGADEFGGLLEGVSDEEVLLRLEDGVRDLGRYVRESRKRVGDVGQSEEGVGDLGG